MIYRVGVKTLKVIALLMSLFLILIFLLTYFHKRERFYREYIKHKEIMFIIANHKTKTKMEINESTIKNIISQNGGEFKSFSKITDGYEIKGKNLSGIRIPQFIFSLEDEGLEIAKFKAIDNTNNGIYDFEIFIK